MLHLHSERLAALADDEPTTDEAAHLLVCAHCRRDRAAYAELRALTRAEAEREHDTPPAPLTSWDSIAVSLREEGLLDAPRSGWRGGASHRGWLRIAAGLMLAAGGALWGRYSAGAPVLGQGGSAIAQGGAVPGDSSFLSVDSAVAVLKRSQAMYQLAAAYLAAHDTTSGGHLYTRLAVLEEMITAQEAALKEAPGDPLINQYYLSTTGAHEATLKQLGSAGATSGIPTRF